jgi:putative membrane protein insertion efficiency factor
MIKKVLISLIFLYKKLLSPVLPPACRFYPSCSDYASGAIECHGVFKGLYLAARRLLRCHPYHPGGYDPVPHREHFDACMPLKKHE